MFMKFSRIIEYGKRFINLNPLKLLKRTYIALGYWATQKVFIMLARANQKQGIATSQN